MEDISLLQFYRNYLLEFLKLHQVSFFLGGVTLYPANIRGEEIYVCFSQPKAENILELCNLKKEIIFL